MRRKPLTKKQLQKLREWSDEYQVLLAEADARAAARERGNG